MKVRDLLAHIDSFAPFSLAEEWDNSGLQVGTLTADISKIAVCLDATVKAVSEASAQGCNVLLTHHPLIFRPMKRVSDESEQGRTVIEAVKCEVNIIAAHTNWDKAPGGVNDTLAALLGLRDIEPLGDFGLVGRLKAALSPDELLNRVKVAWRLSSIDCYGHPAEILRVALCGGSGAEFWRAAKTHGADIYLTADMKYHELSDAVNEGLSIGLINHGEMERATIPELAKKISQCGVETITLDTHALPSPLRI